MGPSGLFMGKKNNSHLLIIISLAFFFLNGCASYIQSPENNAVMIRNLPFYPQESYQCGPSSLASVLDFWGIDITPEAIAKEIYSESVRGTLNIDMVIYAEKKGLKAIQYNGSIDDLKKNIASGIPLIVLVDQGFSIYQANHFMVVVGFNEDGLLVNSGKYQEKFMQMDDFLNSWQKTKNWTLLIKPE